MLSITFTSREANVHSQFNDVNDMLARVTKEQYMALSHQSTNMTAQFNDSYTASTVNSHFATVSAHHKINEHLMSFIPRHDDNKIAELITQFSSSLHTSNPALLLLCIREGKSKSAEMLAKILDVPAHANVMRQVVQACITKRQQNTLDTLIARFTPMAPLLLHYGLYYALLAKNDTALETLAAQGAQLLIDCPVKTSGPQMQITSAYQGLFRCNEDMAVRLLKQSSPRQLTLAHDLYQSALLQTVPATGILTTLLSAGYKMPNDPTLLAKRCIKHDHAASLVHLMRHHFTRKQLVEHYPSWIKTATLHHKAETLDKLLSLSNGKALPDMDTIQAGLIRSSSPEALYGCLLSYGMNAQDCLRKIVRRGNTSVLSALIKHGIGLVGVEQDDIDSGKALSSDPDVFVSLVA